MVVLEDVVEMSILEERVKHKTNSVVNIRVSHCHLSTYT